MGERLIISVLHSVSEQWYVFLAVFTQPSLFTTSASLLQDVVIDMLESLSPLALTFARADTEKKARLRSSPLSLNIDAINTFSIEAADYDHIGCTFVVGNNGTDIVVKSINGVEGSFQRQMNATKLPLIGCVLECVDNEVVPTYVNSQLIINAMSRRWASNDSVKLTFCNLKQKAVVHKIGSESS
jgi:hypothetical protein